MNLKILKFEINRSTKFIDSLKVYNNELTYYNAAKKLFLMYNDIANHEFVDLLKIIEDPDLEAKDFKAKKLKIFDTIKKKQQVLILHTKMHNCNFVKIWFKTRLTVK